MIIPAISSLNSKTTNQQISEALVTFVHYYEKHSLMLKCWIYSLYGALYVMLTPAAVYSLC